MAKNTAPTPSVQHVPTILRRISTGDILVPAFQRGVVWKPNQVIELLRSVYQGFPIGSLLLWKADEESIDPGHLMRDPFPVVEPKSTHNYVLDGQQRLAALFGCLYGPEDRDERFKVAFDLRNATFDYAPSTGGSDWILLSDIFSPKEFLARQQQISRLPQGDELLDNAIKLHSAFQEYMIPLVTIEDRDVGEVVQIFERINSTGTKLDAVDFMRAVTWSQGFDLNKEISKIAHAGTTVGFEFGTEALVRLLAVTMRYKPTSQAMLAMRGQSAVHLRRGVKQTMEAIQDVAQFLAKELGIHSADYVPYEAQLLVVGKLVILDAKRVTRRHRQLVAQWLIASSLNEEFQGKADHRVARIVESVEDLVQGRPHLLTAEVDVAPSALIERRLLRGKALSDATVVVIARNNPRSLVDGEPIDVDSLMRSSQPEVFAPLISKEEMRNIRRKEPVFTKVLANVVVCHSAREALDVEAMGWEATIGALQKKVGKRRAVEVLRSQLISAEAWSALEEGDGSEFLKARATAIVEFAKTLVA